MILCQVKELGNISEKDWLDSTNRQQDLVIFTHKKYPGGTSIHRIDESFPLRPSLVENLWFYVQIFRDPWFTEGLNKNSSNANR